MSLIELQDRWVRLVDKYANSGYASLSVEEKIWLNTQSLIQAIDDGGLISFYYNSGADHLDDAVAALESLGAHRLVAMLNTVNELFGTNVPRDLNERNRIIESWPDDGSIDVVLDDLDEEAAAEARALEDLLCSFVNEKELGA